MIRYSQEEMSNTVLQYLLRHPKAQDTLEGIVAWWLLEERIHQRTAEIRRVLEDLVDKNFLIETRLFDSDILYSLNIERKKIIDSIVGNKTIFQKKDAS
jgi:hypothetical protein